MAAVSRHHFHRYRQIVTVLAKNGFGLLLEQAGVFRALRIRRREIETDETTGEARKPLTAGVRLRHVCETLGPTFVKIGQLLSTRPDLLPSEVIHELEKLQHAVHPIPVDDVEQVILEEFGKPADAVFATFDREPLASASISQVHGATLGSGLRVVVKVQRPGIEESIRIDLEILKDLASLLDNHTHYGETYDLSSMVLELEQALMNELDFIREGENADCFRKNFDDEPGIHFPKIRWVYSTRRVLTMERIDGVRISQTNRLDLLGVDRKALGMRVSETMVKQMLRDGFFHADPHPGNLLITDDGTLNFIDLGQIGRLNTSRKKILTDLFIGMANRNGAKVVEAIVALDTMQQRSALRRFEHDVNNLLEQYLDMPIHDIKVGDLLFKIFDLARKYHVRIPGEFALIAKMLVTLQGIIEKLDDSLDLLTIMKPMARKLLIEQFDPMAGIRKLSRSASALETLLTEAPEGILNFLRKLEDDDYTIYLDLKNRKHLHHQVNQIFNRLAFSVILLAVSIVLAGIIVGSSLTAGADAASFLMNQAILRFGLFLCVIIVIGLIISMFRGRKPR